jgi:hypothetical protein
MYCPKCREIPGDDVAEDEDIECRKCKMIYRLSVSRMSPSLSTTGASSGEFEPEQIEPVFDSSSTQLKRKRIVDEDQDMTLFRRVRIKTSIIASAAESRPIDSDVIKTPFAGQDGLNSTNPMSFEMQDRQNLEQTSSYWSVPEQTDFPALLRHFGTDWHGIAKCMTSKTHIMVQYSFLSSGYCTRC